MLVKAVLEQGKYIRKSYEKIKSKHISSTYEDYLNFISEVIESEKL